MTASGGRQFQQSRPSGGIQIGFYILVLGYSLRLRLVIPEPSSCACISTVHLQPLPNGGGNGSTINLQPVVYCWEILSAWLVQQD